MDKETLKQLKGLHSSEWQPALVSERLEALQELENYYARQQQRPAYTVKAFLADDLRNKGVVAHDEKEIYVNHDHLIHTELHYECINTVIHEGRHAYQVFAANSETHYDPVEEERWIINSRNLVESGEDYLKYFFQPMERDAHYYAKNEVDHLFYQLESEFGKSEYFDNYVESRDYHFQRYESQAEQRWGPDYIREVDRAIGIDEEQIQENLIERGRIEPEVNIPVSKDPEELYWEIEVERDFRGDSTDLEIMRERLIELGYEPGTEDYYSFVDDLDTVEAKISYAEVGDEWIDKKCEEARERLIEMGRIPEPERDPWRELPPGDLRGYTHSIEPEQSRALLYDIHELEERDQVDVVRVLPGGAYVKDDNRLAFVAFEKDENGLYRLPSAREQGEWAELTFHKSMDGDYIRMQGTPPQRAYIEQEAKSFNEMSWEPEELDRATELHAEAEAAYHERARHQERLEKLEAQYEREPSPELQEQIQEMRQELQRLNERENETWANYMKATVEEVEEQDRFNLEYYSPSGAYISNEDRTNLAYVPVSKGQLDLNNIQWNQTKGIRLYMEKNQKGQQYIKMESKEKGVTARAYLKGEAKPFQELKNEWEMEKRTFQKQKDRSQDKELSMER